MYEDTVTKADLLLRISNLKKEIASFESGAKYAAMKKEFDSAREADFRTMQKYQSERDEARLETRRVSSMWYQTTQDLIKEYEKKLAAKDHEITELKKSLQLKNEKVKNERKERLSEIKERIKTETLLKEEREKNEQLHNQLQKDYRTSSESSSMNPNHPPIQNGRVKTGKKPGAQEGHEHHGRKAGIPTKTIDIPTPEEYKNKEKYKPTGKTIKKQLIGISIKAEVIEFSAKEYRNLKTGQRVHAAFPDGITNDVTYDESIKAFVYLVNNGLYTSVGKTRDFINDITHGNICLSDGFISNLSKEFSKKTESERNEIMLKLKASPAVHADFTFGHSAEGQTAVMICATDDAVLYMGRPKKGDEGVKGTPLEDYKGTVISDHEAAIRKRGERHQECLAHVLRYLKGAEMNEKDRTWYKSAIDWINRAVSYWDRVHMGDEKYSKRKAENYIKELREILKNAEEEYIAKPPSKYYTEGRNTFKRMKEDFEEYVLFLRDPSIPPHNNTAERCARKYKRKDHQVMAFRSKEGSELFCDGLTIIESAKARGENLYDGLIERFKR